MSGEPGQISDALGRRVALAVPPQRIISLVPSLTEYLFAVGAGARLVGITDFCSEPAALVAHLPRLRGTKNPDRAAIAALRPDLVLAAKEENRQRDVVALEQAGIPVYVTDVCSVAGALAELATLANILQVAAPLLDELRAAAAAVGQAGPPRARLLAFIWRDPWMVVGADTYASDLLQLCGAENLGLHLAGRYPRADLADLLALDPDVILLPDEPYAFGPADRAAFAPFASVAAVRAQRLHLCDGKLLTWYGSRTLQALQQLPGLLRI